MNSGKLILGVLAGVMCVSLAFADLLNPGFELGPTGGESTTNTPNWTWDVPSGSTHGGKWGDTDVQNWRSHGGSQEAAIHNWGSTAADGGWWQEITNDYGNLSVWTGSLWTWNDNSGSVYTNVSTFVKIEFYDATSTSLGAWTNNFTLSGETWAQVSVVATAPVNTVWSRFVVGATGQGQSGALQIDDTSLTGVAAIPEPMSAGLLLIGLAGIYAVRSKKRS